MKVLTSLALVSAFFSASLGFAQEEKSLHLGLGLGATYGVNESSSDNAINLQERVYLLWENGLAKNLSAEIGLSLTKNSSEKSFAFSNSLTIPDVRLRYSFLPDSKVRPFVYVGAGLVMFSEAGNTAVNPTPMREVVREGTAVYAPIGIGAQYRVNRQWAVELGLGANPTFSDDINPWHDEDSQVGGKSQNDGFWHGAISVLYNLGGAKDSDGDGLSDEDEAKLGTNPNNPDTDGDGLYDGDEVNKYKTNPLDPDTDKGGVKDGAEVSRGTDPLNKADDKEKIKAELGKELILEGISFATASANIEPASEEILEKALEYLNENSTAEVEISGHTDNTGNRDFNMKLSSDRAESVKNWLVGKGISASRITTKGYGPDKPLGDNSTEAGRKRNRRIEFKRTK